jgi:predicted dehydrogenase
LDLSRRAFLYVPSVALFGAAAPSNRVNVGVIGVGRQTVIVNLKQFLAMPDVQVTAVCDIDAWRLENARQQVDKGYGKTGCKTYRDYKELLADKSIDAVMVATPDHWHTPMSLEAFKAGKDVACEKPITRFIAEGRELADTARKHRRVFRNDSEFRSLENFHRTAELVRSGAIGQVHTIHAGVPGTDVGCPQQPDMPVPAGLDYELWQGPAPRAPYTEARVHKPRSYDRPGWMRHTHYCDGMVTNWGAHLIDIAQWGNNTERTGPVSVEARGKWPEKDSFWNVMLQFEAEYKFANGVRMTYRTGNPFVRFEGSEGWISTEFGKGIETSSPSLLEAKLTTRFPLKSDKQDFIDAVKSRGQTLEDAEVGHRVMSICHLANIAAHLGGKLTWEPAKERFAGSDKANALLARPLYERG